MEEKTTMDDFKEELEASFQDTQENDVADITDPAWQTLVQYLEDKTVLTVKIGGIVKSGVVAYVEGIRALSGFQAFSWLCGELGGLAE